MLSRAVLQLAGEIGVHYKCPFRLSSPPPAAGLLRGEESLEPGRAERRGEGTVDASSDLIPRAAQPGLSRRFALSIAGIHCLLELHDCPPARLDDHTTLVAVLEEAARVARSTLLEQVSHRFTPQGVTALALLAESHISIHTWPEKGYAAVDIFTCGDSTRPEEACQFIARRLEAGRSHLQTIQRGGDLPPLVTDPSEDNLSAPLL